MDTTHFGEHYMLDGYRGNKEKLSDPDHIVQCIRSLTEEQKMRCAMEPCIQYVLGNNIKDPGGYSAFVIIHESHISIHTFPENGFVSIDFYTCRNGMDVNYVTEFFTRSFDLEETEVNFIKRGLKYPGLVGR